MEALCGHKAMKLVTWQMIILISITGALKWNAFISPYLQAHVFLFLISLKKPFFSSDLGPNKNSGNQLRVLLQPTPALLFTLVESTSKETVKWRKTEFTIRTEQKGGGRGVERKKNLCLWHYLLPTKIGSVWGRGSELGVCVQDPHLHAEKQEIPKLCSECLFAFNP